MTFVDTLLSWLSAAASYIGDGIQKILNVVAYPLGWLIWLIDGIYYFCFKLVMVVLAVLEIFVALFQMIGAFFIGFFKTIKGFLVIDFSATPVHYPSTTMTGMQYVIQNVLEPIGVMTIVPYILLAVVWLLFVIRVFALLGGETNQDA